MFIAMTTGHIKVNIFKVNSNFPSVESHLMQLTSINYYYI